MVEGMTECSYVLFAAGSPGYLNALILKPLEPRKEETQHLPQDPTPHPHRLIVKFRHEIFILEISEVLKLGAVYEFIAKEETEENYWLIKARCQSVAALKISVAEDLHQNTLPLHQQRAILGSLDPTP